MKTYILFFLLLTSGTVALCLSTNYGLSTFKSQIDTAKVIEDIKRNYQIIKARESSFKKSTRNIDDESSEGGQADVFYDGDQMKKMVIIHFGEMGKVKSEYYIDNGKVLFIHITRTMYNKPMYQKGSKISSLEEDKYYFYRDKMIRWLDSSKNIVSPNSDIFLQREKQLLNASLLNFND